VSEIEQNKFETDHFSFPASGFCLQVFLWMKKFLEIRGSLE
jgi:hypothetical protein